jgi:hypothetical protein
VAWLCRSWRPFQALHGDVIDDVHAPLLGKYVRRRGRPVLWGRTIEVDVVSHNYSLMTYYYTVM